MDTNKLQLLTDDPWLSPFEDQINGRFERFQNKKNEIEKQYGSLKSFAAAYKYLGLNYDKEEKGWWYREWAPEAISLRLIGEFNDWDNHTHILTKNHETGIWEIFIEGKKTLAHESKFKVQVETKEGTFDRLPAYINKVIQDPTTHSFDAQVWKPKKFDWTDKHFDLEKLGTPIIYECHVGMAQEIAGVGTYLEFIDNVLPRIKKLGYNCIQLMAVQEHPYYGSFGYHVSNFFAPTSRFGNPEDLRKLIDCAHNMGIAVIMDIVHSHAVKNFYEGLNNFDGSEGQYFHEGGRGYHTGWDSKLFNYGKTEVLQFLLSNVRYWLKEFHFDGFRFDGVTSMLYFHHGEGVSFDNYEKYFKDAEWDAITYLQLANELIHEIKPHAISIAEDMSGMPGLCRPLHEGGIGFDYRLAMGIPDYWIKLLKHKTDDEWNIHEMWHTLTNRRFNEKTIAYAESHDQALVGDKTLAFWLMDKEMYFHMQVNDQNVVVDRGIALHKMIRFFTITLGGDAYLNFIGNEFGHPEWVDFPREGNDWSYQHARRQWSLADNSLLKYKFLQSFDQQMISIIKKYDLLNSLPAQQWNMDTHNNTIIFERNNLIFIFNFHPNHSIPNYDFIVPEKGEYKIILNSDSASTGGFNRVDDSIIYKTFTDTYEIKEEIEVTSKSGKTKIKKEVRIEEQHKLRLYITNRTCLVLEKI